MMLRHREPEFGDGGAAVSEQTPAEFGIGPGAGNDARPVLRNPLLLGSVLEFGDGRGRCEATLFERRRNRGGALLHRGGD